MKRGRDYTDYLRDILTYAEKAESLKQKIGTLIEEDITAAGQRRAAEEGRTLSDQIQDALVQYLRKDAATPVERKMAYQILHSLDYASGTNRNSMSNRLSH